eukprot:TRINITY_DN12274_c0_g1_i2.p1 TRINITY_DN12274_c0_g1~~TRINITY_DN12274_c0_g1_i2.p1  ORF type:complete len:459 (-),score=105.02 TRINITY_DN12274_c0_g1_i2:104-1480(-)
MSLPVVAEWTPSSWRSKPIKQQPNYEDKEELQGVLGQIANLPPLVHPNEIEDFKAQLRLVEAGDKFLLQGGDCAERFQDCNSRSIEGKLKILLQMSLVLCYAGRTPVVRVARMAGQYAKPRSADSEIVDGKPVLSFRGDNVNGFDPSDRRHDPSRLLMAYFHSASTLNYIRASLAGGFADLRHPEHWNFDYVKDKGLQQEYNGLVESILDSMDFFQTIHANLDENSLGGVSIYTSHEGLILDYEEALTRTAKGGSTKAYNCGAHFLWIGDRTRNLDGAHVEYFSGIENPIGIKVGPTMQPDELVELLTRINPDNDPGKVTLITRFGADKVDKLEAHVRAVLEAKQRVIWSCDPMHGNTHLSSSGFKTRAFQKIHSEVTQTLELHNRLGSRMGGIHLEMTGDNVTECTGGSQALLDDDLAEAYETYCDPRLNYTQSLDLAFSLAKSLRSKRKSPLVASQ